MTKQELIAFEEHIKNLYEQGKIKAPIHLSRGNEENLIAIFRQISPDDWVFSTHRSHYHALLKGIPPDWLTSEILAGRSISLMNAEYKFFSSGIVGGCLPIAVGVALGIKRKGGDEQVWVFIGDMAAETGIFHETLKYSGRNGLPISFVIEDNQLSVNTPTQESWGLTLGLPKVIRYQYEREYPHHGTGKWVSF